MTRWPVPNPWSAPVFYLDSTGSTMEDAQRLGAAGCPGGTVVVAGFQERGRGRNPERSWAAEAGSNLLFTLLLDLEPAFPPQRLPVLAGLALAQALEDRFGLATEVKWPNDLLYRGRKLAGILCEARAQPPEPARALVGMGVNCNQRAFPQELAGRACSLAELLGSQVALPELLADILTALHATLCDEGWRARLERRLYGLGREALLSGPSGGIERGTVRGVAEDGALLLEVGGRVLPVYSGELSFQVDA